MDKPDEGLKALLELGKRRGFLTFDQVNDVLPDDPNSPERIQGLLETLDERERTIVYLRFFEDLSQSEIAEQVGMSQVHVSRLLRRALRDLKELVTPDDEDDSTDS